jgi:hypothetical protein
MQVGNFIALRLLPRRKVTSLPPLSLALSLYRSLSLSLSLSRSLSLPPESGIIQDRQGFSSANKHVSLKNLHKNYSTVGLFV